MLAVLEEIEALGVEIFSQGGNLVIQPASRVPSELKERLRAHKAEVLAVLKPRPAACSPTCYEVEPGRWIHHPWDGCKIIQSARARSDAEGTCTHCDGAGKCPCPSCTLRLTSEAVPCHICHPMERQAWLAATRPEGCWHCGGNGKCKCIACAEAALAGECAECSVCHGTRKVLAWVT